MNTPRLSQLIRIGTVATALVLGGAAAHARPGAHHGPGMMSPDGPFGGHVVRMLGRVDATEAQRSQIEAIFKAARTELAAQRESGKQLRGQMLSLYTATNVDAAAIESVRTQIAAQRDAASKRMSQASIEAARVLTPEQRVKLAEMMTKRKGRTPGRQPG
jgi:protein CpxP